MQRGGGAEGQRRSHRLLRSISHGRGLMIIFTNLPMI
jgi:hypothetical protein